MAKTYSIRPGDTMQAIAQTFYGDATLYAKLSQYNGIVNPNMIVAGRAIEVPSRRELDGAPPARPAASPAPPAPPHALPFPPPNGLDGVIATFGDIYRHIRPDGGIDPGWERTNIVRVDLPFGAPYAWDHSLTINRLACHRKLKDVIPAVFVAIERAGLKDRIRTLDGCYNFRTKRKGGRLSVHSWGIAVDINPETNAMGTAGDMDHGIVEVFRSFGFKWGGDWTGGSKDPMHFQYCTGY